MMSLELLDIFNARSGVVSCVGAGGKKTTLFRLAAAHMGRVGITATVHIEFFPRTLEATNFIGDERDLLEAVKNDKDSSAIAFARPSERFGRRAGVSLDSIEKFKEMGDFELLLIKADGSRGRYIKAPAEHEPAIAACSDTVIPVMSARVIGSILNDEIAHRVEKISAVTGLKAGDKFKSQHIARLLASPEGSLKNTESAKVVPLINMVDNSELEKVAHEAAIGALQLTDRFDTVVLAAMKKDQPIVDVVTR